MKLAGWLSENQVRALAVELLTPEVANRVSQKLSAIHNQFFEVNGMYMYTIMLNTITSCQNQIDNLLEREAKYEEQINLTNNSGIELPSVVEEDEYDLDKLSGLSYEDRKTLLRDTYGYNRYALYGSLISGKKGIGSIEGTITWSEVEKVRQIVYSFIEEKEKRLNNIFNQDNNDITTSSSKVILNNDKASDDFNKAQEYLKLFNGKNIEQRHIMKHEDYVRMISYVRYMIYNEKLPESIEPIPQINLTNEFIRYTFYLIHKDLYTTKSIRPYFIDFLHHVFTQFTNGSWETTKIKFSKEPRLYKSDLKLLSE